MKLIVEVIFLFSIVTNFAQQNGEIAPGIFTTQHKLFIYKCLCPFYCGKEAVRYVLKNSQGHGNNWYLASCGNGWACKCEREWVTSASDNACYPCLRKDQEYLESFRKHQQGRKHHHRHKHHTHH